MSTQSSPCEEVTKAVNICHRKYGKQGEDCVRQELAQKKCFAHLLCRNEARTFYDEKSIPLSKANQNSKISCSTLLEVFAKPENEMMISEGIQKNDRQFCRKIAHELAGCLQQKRNNNRSSIS